MNKSELNSFHVTETLDKTNNASDTHEMDNFKVIHIGSVVKLTQGGPDGQWSDGNSPTNPFRFKK